MVTVTEHVAVAPLSLEVHVIVAVPGLTPVTIPDVLTLAMSELLVDHVTFLFVALDGVKLTDKDLVPLTLMLVLVGETAIELVPWYVLYSMLNSGRLLSTEQWQSKMHCNH